MTVQDCTDLYRLCFSMACILTAGSVASMEPLSMYLKTRLQHGHVSLKEVMEAHDVEEGGPPSHKHSILCLSLCLELPLRLNVFRVCPATAARDHPGETRFRAASTHPAIRGDGLSD